jgi:hypothetical protein
MGDHPIDLHHQVPRHPPRIGRERQGLLPPARHNALCSQHRELHPRQLAQRLEGLPVGQLRACPGYRLLELMAEASLPPEPGISRKDAPPARQTAPVAPPHRHCSQQRQHRAAAPTVMVHPLPAALRHLLPLSALYHQLAQLLHHCLAHPLSPAQHRALQRLCASHPPRLLPQLSQLRTHPLRDLLPLLRLVLLSCRYPLGLAPTKRFFIGNREGIMFSRFGQPSEVTPCGLCVLDASTRSRYNETKLAGRHSRPCHVAGPLRWTWTGLRAATRAQSAAIREYRSPADCGAIDAC